MARPPLRCWWDGVHVADFIPRQPWDLRCGYTGTALDRWATNTPLLSCSLPVQRRAQDGSAFLRGLLPEGAHLQALAALAGVAANDTYGLLARYGRDVAGALTLTSSDDTPSATRSHVEPYTPASFAAEVTGLDEHALGVRADSELSIAGLQNKLLLVELGNGQWGRPVHGHPSTHILKVDDPRRPGLVEAEAQCLRLAQRLGLTSLDPITTAVGGLPCMIVRRYDRIVSGGEIARAHQEDACQALGIDPQAQRGRAKYEDAGGPSLAQIAGLLRRHAGDRDRELAALTAAVTFTCAIGNADAHGKNISFLNDGDGRISLAPLYDTVPTALWPDLRATAAMAVNGRRDFGRITVHDIAAEASRWGLTFDRALAVAVDTCEQIAAGMADVVSHDALATRLATGIDRLLGAGPEHGGDAPPRP